MLAVLNKLIQGPLIYDSERFPSLSLPDDLREQQLKAIDDNDVLLANRRFICHVFQDDLDDARGGFLRWLGRTSLGAIDWPRNQVSVSADGRFIMCGDMPLLTGENLKWQDAADLLDCGARPDLLDFSSMSAPMSAKASRTIWPGRRRLANPSGISSTPSSTSPGIASAAASR